MDLDSDFERCKRLDNLEEAEAAVAVASALQTASQILVLVVDFC